MRSILIAMMICLGTTARATTPEYIEIKEVPPLRSELSFAAGVALQTGYLTSKDSVGTYSLGANMLMPGGLLSIEWQNFEADHDTSEFNLNNGKTVMVSTMSFIPYVLFYARNPWYFYGGIGFANVGLYQVNPDYLVYYGSFILSGLIRYEINPKWSIQYKTQWYDVHQIINDQKTSFEVWNHMIGVGYSLF